MNSRLAKYVTEVLVTDGGWGTELQFRGLPAGHCPDAWNIDNPSPVEEVARSYVQAGSEIILTNTFGSNRISLGKWDLSAKAAQIAEAGARISRQAAGSQSKVFGSIGPSGKILMMGQVDPDELYQAFSEQAQALARGGADGIVVESFTDLEEAAIAGKAARENTLLPVVVSLTFDSGPDRTATMMGNQPADLVRAAKELGFDAIGGNCGSGPETFVQVARMLRAASDLPVWIKPNAGLPALERGRTVFPLGPVEFARFVPRLAEAGANFIGGCCGTTPEHIRAVRRAVGPRLYL